MLTYTTVRNPRWANAEKNMIDCLVLFDSIGVEIPFTAFPDDVEEHGREIFSRAVAGDFGPVEDYVPPPPKPEPVPATISARQLFQKLAVDGEIPLEEAIAAVRTGEIPSRLKAFVDTLREPEKTSAIFLLSGSKEFERSHPMVNRVGRALGWTPEQIDNLFREAAKL